MRHLTGDGPVASARSPQQLAATQCEEQQDGDTEIDGEAGGKGGQLASGSPALATTPLVMPP